MYSVQSAHLLYKTNTKKVAKRNFKNPRIMVCFNPGQKHHVLSDKSAFCLQINLLGKAY